MLKRMLIEYVQSTLVNWELEEVIQVQVKVAEEVVREIIATKSALRHQIKKNIVRRARVVFILKIKNKIFIIKFKIHDFLRILNF